MPKVVSVRFRDAGKIYHFDPVDFHFHLGDAVIVETSQGLDLGHVAEESLDLPIEQIVEPLRPIIRFADDEDNQRYERSCCSISYTHRIKANRRTGSGKNDRRPRSVRPGTLLLFVP